MNLVVGGMFIFFGVLGALFPRTMFKFDTRNLFYKNREPSEFGVCATRWGSVLLLILGLIFCLDQEIFITFFDH